jgi:hypothetical protein
MQDMPVLLDSLSFSSLSFSFLLSFIPGLAVRPVLPVKSWLTQQAAGVTGEC